MQCCPSLPVDTLCVILCIFRANCYGLGLCFCHFVYIISDVNDPYRGRSPALADTQTCIINHPCFYPFRTTDSLSLISEKPQSKDRWYARNSHLQGRYFFLLRFFVTFQKCARACKYFHDKDPPPGDKGR